jgi:hypothetical protein
MRWFKAALGQTAAGSVLGINSRPLVFTQVNGTMTLVAWLPLGKSWHVPWAD